MRDILRNPSFLPACILAGIGTIFLVLVSVLPLTQVLALVAGTVLAIGLVLARLRREAVENEPAPRARARAQG
jgi:hypothetical protein